MNLTASLLAVAGQNLSSTLQDIGGITLCQTYYQKIPSSRDCKSAIGLLEKGTAKISYEVHSGIGPHALPLSKNFGDCMVQVEIAGPALPQTFDIIPDYIRHMANEVLNTCVLGPDEVGGFATSDLQEMEKWITAEETSLDMPFPPSTAFLTVTVTPKVPDWLSPGNYDPMMAFHLSKVELEAIDRASTRRQRVDLRERAERLLRQGNRMQPRGNRVPWWENPGDLGVGTSLVSINLPEPLASGADTATSKRRRRT